MKKLFNNRKIYLSYYFRLGIFAFLFFLSLAITYFFFTKTIHIENSKIISYKEDGVVDYRVYLKKNTFYETDYLNKDMYYVASLIDNVKIDMNYNFYISEKVNTNFSYKIVAVLSINDSEKKKTLFEKKYILKEVKVDKKQNVDIETINQNIEIDYDYYNSIANRFKSTYGVDADASLTVYLDIDKLVSNDSQTVSINNVESMSVRIPLSQKTIEIMINENNINSSNNIITQTKVSKGNILFGILTAMFFVAMVAALLSLLELLVIMIPRKNKYDKYISKLLKEYDRLIVESYTEPDFEGKQIIKIVKFLELLDVRDNLKKPIMYYNLINHHKSYFYIENENKVYLLILKTADFEVKNEKRKK